MVHYRKVYHSFFMMEVWQINYLKRQGALRETVINQTLSCLIGKARPNAFLVGAAGVGKTVIVEDIAGGLARRDPRIPDQRLHYNF